MLIPWGHDSSQLRRRPWVTYGIALACVVGFLAAGGLRDPALAEAEQGLWDAHAYWAAHPYLPPHERLVRALGPLGEEDVAAWRAAGSPVPDLITMEAEKAELAVRVSRALERLDDHAWVRYGLVPARPTAVGLFGHMFLHGGLAHLLGNLWFLILAGPYIEDRFGRVVFSAFYLASGLAGAALFVAMQPGFDGPLIGASGAISGLLGAFLVCCRKVRIRFFYWILLPGTFSAPAWVMLPLWFGNELASAMALGGGGPVAYWTHVGGFAFGVLAAFGLRAAGLDARLTAELGGLGDGAGHPVRDAVRQHLRDGHIEEAIGHADEALRDGSGDEGAVQAYLEAVRAGGREHEAPDRLLEHFWAAIEWRKKEAALALWSALAEAGTTPSGRGEALLQVAGWLRGAGRPTEARLALQQALVGADRELAVRVARAARRADPLLVRRAAEAAIANPQTPADDRRAMEALLAEALLETRRRGWVLLEPGERIEKGRGRPPVAPGSDAARGVAVEAPDDASTVHAPSTLKAGPEPDAVDRHASAASPDPGATRARGPRLAHGEPIDVSDIVSEAAPPVAALPDPEEAGSEAFLDALHATLEAEGFSDDDLGAGEAELTPVPEGPDLGAPGAASDMFDLDAEDLGGVAEPLELRPPAGSGRSGSLAPEPAVEEPPADEAPKREAPPRRPLRVVPAVPLGLDATHLSLDVEGRGRSRLALDRIDAVAVAGIGGLSTTGKAVLLLDLCLNWRGDGALQIVRMRSDAFDPRTLVEAERSPLKALRAFAAQLVAQSRAAALPGDADPEAPFKIFSDLARYQREVLSVVD